jgi:hypothetical protein
MSSSARALAAAGAAALALAAAAPAAHAEVRHVYDAWFSSGVSYATDEASENGNVTRRTSAKFTASGWFRDLRFIDGRLLTQRPAEGTQLDFANAELHYVNRDVEPVDVADCADSAPRVVVPGIANPLWAFDPRAAPTAIGIASFGMVGFDLNCDVGGTTLGIGVLAHRPGDLGPGHLRAEVVVPRDRLGDEQIVLRYERVFQDVRRCPGDYVESDLRSCTTAVRGSLRLFRTYTDAASEDDLLAPPPPKRPRIDRGARRGRAQVRCPRGCRYRIRIFEPPRRGRGTLGRALPAPASSAAEPVAAAAAATPRARAAVAAVASRSGRLPASRTARAISVTIPPARRAALIEAGAALVAIELDPPRGKTVRATFLAPVAG